MIDIIIYCIFFLVLWDIILNIKNIKSNKELQYDLEEYNLEWEIYEH